MEGRRHNRVLYVKIRKRCSWSFEYLMRDLWSPEALARTCDSLLTYRTRINMECGTYTDANAFGFARLSLQMNIRFNLQDDLRITEFFTNIFSVNIAFFFCLRKRRWIIAGIFSFSIIIRMHFYLFIYFF